MRQQRDGDGGDRAPCEMNITNWRRASVALCLSTSAKAREPSARIALLDRLFLKLFGVKMKIIIRRERERAERK